MFFLSSRSAMSAKLCASSFQVAQSAVILTFVYQGKAHIGAIATTKVLAKFLADGFSRFEPLQSISEVVLLYFADTHACLTLPFQKTISLRFGHL